MTWWWLRWHRRHGQVILAVRYAVDADRSDRVYLCEAGHEKVRRG